MTITIDHNGTITLETSQDLKHLESKIDAILELQKVANKELVKIMLDLTALQTAVANEKSVEDSVVTLLGQLSQKITDLINQSGNTVDPAALQAIVDSINANKDTLASAVTANTPAA